MDKKIINFGAGPAHIPRELHADIIADIDNWQHSGLSILEVGHRSAAFINLVDHVCHQVRALLCVPEDFAVLLMPAGGQAQFAMTAMNLTAGFSSANYVDTGHWSAKALKEAGKYTHIHICSSAAELDYLTIPDCAQWPIQHDAAYTHYCDNETIGGLEFPQAPEIEGPLLVADMSSNIFSRPIDFSRFGCIYACAQKNIGIAGMSLVLVREAWLDRAQPITPTVFHYKTQHQNGSMAATPPTFAIYVASKMLAWMAKLGSIETLGQMCVEKSSLLYDYIDKSGIYHNPIDHRMRSRMNIPFRIHDSSLESLFLQQATEHGLLNLKGHRSVGGMRASLYHSISIDDVRQLISFMQMFEQEQG